MDKKEMEFKIINEHPILKKMVNNDFIIIPFDKIIAYNVNEDSENLRLHIDICKGE